MASAESYVLYAYQSRSPKFTLSPREYLGEIEVYYALPREHQVLGFLERSGALSPVTHWKLRSMKPSRGGAVDLVFSGPRGDVRYVHVTPVPRG